MSSLFIREGGSVKSMSKDVRNLETYISGQLLCINGDWKTTMPSLKGNDYEKAKWYVRRFAELRAMPMNDKAVMVALRTCVRRIFDLATRIEYHG